MLTDPELLLSAWQEQNRIDHSGDLTHEEIKRLHRQISDGNNQRKRLFDAYEKGAIELEELISRRSSVEKRIEQIQMKIDNISTEPNGKLSFGNLKDNIGEVCHSLSGQLNVMTMNRKMRLCQDLIEKVVVEQQNVEIHYKFPVSSNSNKKRERPKVIVIAVRIGALDSADPLEVVAASTESFTYFLNALKSETTVSLGIAFLVPITEIFEVFSEYAMELISCFGSGDDKTIMINAIVICAETRR